MNRIGLTEIKKRAKALEGFDQATGTERPSLSDAWGPPAVIGRKYRDGRESYESLPLWLAKQVVAAIPECEPRVERARLMIKSGGR